MKGQYIHHRWYHINVFATVGAPVSYSWLTSIVGHIVHTVDLIGEYHGHTTQLATTCHLFAYNYWCNSGCSFMSSFEVLKFLSLNETFNIV